MVVQIFHNVSVIYTLMRLPVCLLWTGHHIVERTNEVAWMYACMHACCLDVVHFVALFFRILGHLCWGAVLVCTWRMLYTGWCAEVGGPIDNSSLYQADTYVRFCTRFAGQRVRCTTWAYYTTTAVTTLKVPVSRGKVVVETQPCWWMASRNPIRYWCYTATV